MTDILKNRGPGAVDSERFKMIGTIDDAQLCQPADTLARCLWPCIVQLFLWETHPAERPESLGSAVLVRTRNGVFIFSAAHVLAAFKNKVIWVGAGGGFMPLEGEHQFRITGHPEMGDHQNDPVDAAVDLLPPKYASVLEARAFDFSTSESATDQEEPRYLLLGQPANRTEIDTPKKEIRSEQKALICSEVKDAVYTKMGYDKRTHLLLGWRSQWRTATGVHGARNLKGSSGGGIWRFSPCTTDAAELVGTFTELRHNSGRKVLVGTRIHIHLELAGQCGRPLLSKLTF